MNYCCATNEIIRFRTCCEGDSEEFNLLKNELNSTQKSLIAQIELNYSLRDQIELMEKDDKQVMVVVTNLKNSNRDLWYKLMNMPIEINRLT